MAALPIVAGDTRGVNFIRVVLEIGTYTRCSQNRTPFNPVHLIVGEMTNRHDSRVQDLKSRLPID